MSDRVFRFAPSPNGYLHLGHALSALTNADAAAATGGRLLLRIEDIDATRARDRFEAAIFTDLAWLGMTWQEPVLRQIERFDAYRKALGELDRFGLVYPAFLSRGEIRAAVAELRSGGRDWPCDPDGAPLYPGTERDWSEARRRKELAGGRPYALRLDMARALSGPAELTWRESDPFGLAPDVTVRADPAAWGDVILARKDTPASYHLAVTVDDAFQGVTDIVRGLDLKPATGLHRLLQDLLGLPEPAYFHHRLILDEHGRKLSKSEGSAGIRNLRESGVTPAEIRRRLGLN
ncbi:MAG TPA: tRNA glutamyl-Q(34) synthetase GluQRS [Afifellaceae bacterium]|nr:tRNA glutamyl-Q(34) synthetase GluQRS [Afifellaceae bacterium]